MNLTDVTDTPGPQAIDPRTLGRPMHLLPAFAARFGADLSEFLRAGLNRRYGTALVLESIEMRRGADLEPPARWMVCRGETGRLGVALSRSLVLRLLQCRYGLPAEEPLPCPETSVVTASEERLASKLALDFAQALAQRVQAGMALPRPSGTAPALSAAADAALPTGPWWLEAWLAEPERGERHALRLSLDEGWLDQLLEQLSQGRQLGRDSAAKPDKPLAQQLKLRLVARLLQQRMPLGQVLDLRVGSVLPIPQPTTVVLVKDAPLFSASVAEHKGRLWLTGFQDI